MVNSLIESACITNKYIKIFSYTVWYVTAEVMQASRFSSWFQVKTCAFDIIVETCSLLLTQMTQLAIQVIPKLNKTEAFAKNLYQVLSKWLDNQAGEFES